MAETCDCVTQFFLLNVIGGKKAKMLAAVNVDNILICNHNNEIINSNFIIPKVF